MFDKLKNQYRNLAEKIKEVPLYSQLFQKGIITPQEFILAGDKLIQVSPIWQWNSSQVAQPNKGLTSSKQFLSAQIYSRERFNTTKHSLIVKTENEFEFITSQEQPKLQKKKTQTLDSSSDEDNQSENEQQNEEQKSLRIYNVYITYDYYYNTARFWINGLDYQNCPLTKQQIYEDICKEYIDKTITEQENPYLKIQMLSVHPCHHADVMKQLYNQQTDQDYQLQVDDYLIIFLKFIASVMPSLLIDFTQI